MNPEDCTCRLSVGMARDRLAHAEDRLGRCFETLEFLEARNESDRVFELAPEIQEAITALSSNHPARGRLGLLRRALLHDMHFVHRHRRDYPQCLFACLWNSLWWYDAPEARKYFQQPKTPAMVSSDRESPVRPAWHETVARWRCGKELQMPDLVWVRSLQPPQDSITGGTASVWEAHKGAVRAIALPPDEALVATNGDDAICIWERQTGRLHARIEISEYCPQQLLFSPEGTRLAAVCVRDSTKEEIHILDVAHGERVSTFRQTFEHMPRQVCRSKSGRYFATSDQDKTVRVRDLQTGRFVVFHQIHLASVGAITVSTEGDLVASGDDSGWVCVYDISRKTCVAHWQVHASAVNGIALMDDRQMAISAFDGPIAVWDFRTQQQLSILSRAGPPIYSMAWSAEVQRLTVSRPAGTQGFASHLVWWQFSNNGVVRCGRRRSVLPAVVSADGRRAAFISDSRNRKAIVAEIETGRTICRCTIPQGQIVSLALSPQGESLLVYSATGSTGEYSGFSSGWVSQSGEESEEDFTESSIEDEVTGRTSGGPIPGSQQRFLSLFDTTQNRWVATASSQDVLGWFPATSPAFSPDGQSFIAREVYSWGRWNATNLQRLGDVDRGGGGGWKLAWTADGQRLATICWNGNMISWDANSGVERARVSGSKWNTFCNAFSTDGERFATSTVDNDVQVWETRTGSLIRQWSSTGGPVTGLTFAPDNRKVFVAELGGSIRVLDPEQAQPCSILSTTFHRIGTMTVSSDERYLACTSVHDDQVNPISRTPDDERNPYSTRIAIWDLRNGSRLQEWDTDELLSKPKTLSFNAAGTRLVIVHVEFGTFDLGLFDAVRLQVRDLATGRDLMADHWESSQVGVGYGIWSAVAWTSDAETAFCGLVTGTVRTFELDSEDRVVRRTPIGHSRRIQSFDYSPDGTLLATASEDNTVRTWDATTGCPIGEFRSRYLGPTYGIAQVVFGADNELVSLDSGQNRPCVRFWKTGTHSESELHEVGDHTEVTALTPDRRQFIVAQSGQWPCSLTVFAMESGQKRTLLDYEGRIRAVAIAPEGDRIAVAAQEFRHVDVPGDLEAQVCLLELATGKRVHLYCVSRSSPWEFRTPTALALAPDRKFLAAGDENGRVRIWRGVANEFVWINEAASGAVSERILELRFSADGSRLYVRQGNSFGNETVEVWNTATWERVAEWPGTHDLSAIAAGSARYPWQAIVHEAEGHELTIASAGRRQPLVWFPLNFGLLRWLTHPFRPIWAGTFGNRLQCICLEGPQIPEIDFKTRYDAILLQAERSFDRNDLTGTARQLRELRNLCRAHGRADKEEHVAAMLKDVDDLAGVAQNLQNKTGLPEDDF